MTYRMKAILLLSVLVPANAYMLGFYDDVGNCAGQFLGSWVGGPAQGCQHNFVGIASSVTIESTGPADDDTNTIARFYSSSDCTDGTQIAEGDVGCIGVSGGGISSYNSFKIDYRPLGDLPQISGAISASPVTESTTLAARSPRTKSRASYAPSATQRPNSHGDLRQFNGITYRLQQIHEGGFLGIGLDEWDDNVHVPSSASAPQPSTRHMVNVPRNFTTRPRQLDDRTINSVCQNMVVCSNRVIAGAVSLAGVFTDVILAAAADAQAKQQQVGVYLEAHPYFRELFFGALSGIPGDVTQILIVLFVNSNNPNDIGSCSLTASQTDALLDAFESRMSTLIESAAVTITMYETITNTYTTITMAAVECGFYPEGDQCGVPTGTCLNTVGTQPL